MKKGPIRYATNDLKAVAAGLERLRGVGTVDYSNVQSILLHEWTRAWSVKDSLERRAITMITTSGVLVTLAFGFATAITKGSHYRNFSLDEKIILVISLGFFAVSAFLALLTNVAKGYSQPLLQELVDVNASTGLRRDTPKEDISALPLTQIQDSTSSVQALNEKKAYLLTYGFWAQLLAIGLLVVAVCVVVV
jgi:hypothetical protein